MNIPLTKSAWKAADLERQCVEFRISRGHDTIGGAGKFLAADCPDGLLSLSIVVDLTVRGGAEWVQYRYPLSQADVNRIEPHPDQSVAGYRLWNA